MKLLLHTCCAPCSLMCVEALRAEELEPTLFWNNPNIHPFTEHRERRDTLISYARGAGLSLVIQGGYGLDEFLELTMPRGEGRCGICYDMRLEKTAEYAAQNGFDAISTTLLISPYQKHEMLQEAARRAAEKYGIAFIYRDFRPYFREGQRRARELGMYMQKYCGCIFSEQERYSKQT